MTSSFFAQAAEYEETEDLGFSVAVDDSQDRSLIFVETNLMACMVHGQQVMARWIDSHPKETVQEWECRMVDRRKAEI